MGMMCLYGTYKSYVLRSDIEKSDQTEQINAPMVMAIGCLLVPAGYELLDYQPETHSVVDPFLKHFG